MPSRSALPMKPRLSIDYRRTAGKALQIPTSQPLRHLYGKMFDEIWLASEVELEFRQLGI